MKRIRNFFNWLAEEPDSQYTLGSLVNDGFVAEFSRAARITERAVMGASILAVAFFVATTPVSVPVVLTAGIGLFFGKVASFSSGVAIEMAVRLIDHVTSRIGETNPIYKAGMRPDTNR